jgi:hypothetical protein
MRYAPTPGIKAAQDIVEWFGGWLDFGDCEVLALHINRGGTSQLRLYAFYPSDRVGEDGYFIRERETEVVFEFSDIRSIQVTGEDADVQNSVTSLDIEQRADGCFRLGFDSNYGIAMEIVVGELSVRRDPQGSVR